MVVVRGVAPQSSAALVDVAVDIVVTNIQQGHTWVCSDGGVVIEQHNERQPHCHRHMEPQARRLRQQEVHAQRDERHYEYNDSRHPGLPASTGKPLVSPSAATWRHLFLGQAKMIRATSFRPMRHSAGSRTVPAWRFWRVTHSRSWPRCDRRCGAFPGGDGVVIAPQCPHCTCTTQHRNDQSFAIAVFA